MENVKNRSEETAASASQTFHEGKEAAKEAVSNLGQQARDTASAVSDKAREYAGQAGDKARQFASQAGNKAEETMHSVGQGMSSLAGSIRQSAPQSGMLGTAAGSVAEQLETGGRYLREHDLGDIGEDVTQIIRRYPIPALLCIFGVGFVMGSALRR